MHKELVDLLAVPLTGEPLALTVSKGDGDWVEEGTLTSPNGLEYPITKGIPRFVDPETYADNFGLQWKRFRHTQLDTSTDGDLSRRRLDAETRWTIEEIRDRCVLDAGCGAGRFAEVAAARGARVVALDLSSAVDAAAETLRQYKNVDVVQGSLLAMPFRRGVFDYAYCIGVIQHTPSPQEAIRHVIDAVKPGGKFAFTIYARRPWTKLNGKYLLRRVLKRVPSPTLLKLVETSMPVVFPITDVAFRIPVLGPLARFAIPVATYTAKQRPGWTREQRYQEAVLDTFDMLGPRYDSPMTWRDVRKAVQASKARSCDFVSKVPVNVVGTR